MDLRMNLSQSSRPGLGITLTLALLTCAANLPAHAIQVSARATYANNQAIDDDIWYVIEQRSLFLQAESALRQRDMPRFRRLRDELENYPLYPYLEFADISQRLGSTSNDEIEAFLARYSATQLAWRLRATWLKLLARRGHWEKYLDVYEQTDDATMRCQWLRALINANQTDKAMAYVEALWLVGRSQPPACDPVFTAWRSAGNMTRELVLRRIELAIRNGRPSLAAYLIRSLASEEQPLATEWIRVRKEPARVMQVARMAGDRDIIEAILVYGVERAARRNPEQAATIWKALRTRFVFSGSAVATLHRRIGLAYAFAHRSRRILSLWPRSAWRSVLRASAARSPVLRPIFNSASFSVTGSCAASAAGSSQTSNLMSLWESWGCGILKGVRSLRELGR